MKLSRRAQRMERHHRRSTFGGGLNLVALMDIFTILVFFLLVNSSDVQEMPSSRAVKLPESNIEAKVRQTITVLVTKDEILVQGEPVLAVAAAASSKQTVLAPLRDALERHARHRLVMNAENEADKGEVTILGDKSLPFELLKKVMATCTDAGYSTVSLAVQQRGVKEGKSS